MKDFNEFISYTSQHIDEIKYDIVKQFKILQVKNDSLTQSDIDLVQKIAYHTVLALLRQYHDWHDELLPQSQK